MSDWDWIFEPVIIAIIVAIVLGVLSSIYLILKQKIKRRPQLEMVLERTMPWTNIQGEMRESRYFNRMGIDPQMDIDILSIKVPDELILKRYNTKWRHGYWSTGDYNTIKEYTKDIHELLDYSLARSNNRNLGPWYFGIIPDRTAWFIFHFKDDFYGKERCYCKRFRLMQTTYPWKVERKQIRNKLDSWKLFKHKECKNCLFQSKWNTNDLSEFEEAEANLVVKSMLDTVFKPQELTEGMNQMEKIDETEIAPTEAETVVRPEWIIVYNKKLIKVPNNDHEKISISLSKEDKINGIVNEKDNQLFDFFIMNEAEYSIYKRNGKFDTLNDDCYDENSYPIDYIIPITGEWYFVFDATLKKNDRLVEFTLRHLKNK